MDDRELQEKLLEALGILANRKPKPLPAENLGSFRKICEACFDLKEMYLDKNSFNQLEHLAETIENNYESKDQIHFLDHIINTGSLIGSMPLARCKTYAALQNKEWSFHEAARLTLGIDPRLYHYLNNQAFEGIKEREMLLSDSYVSPKDATSTEIIYPSITLRQAMYYCEEAGVKPHEPLANAYLAQVENNLRGGSQSNRFSEQASTVNGVNSHSGNYKQIRHIGEKDHELEALKAEIERLKSEPAPNSKNAMEDLIVAVAWDAYGLSEKGNSIGSVAKVLEGVVTEKGKANLSRPKHGAIEGYLKRALERHRHLLPPR